MYKHQYRIRAPQDVSTQPENICLSISTCCIYVPLTCDKYVLWENISIKYKSEIEKSKYNYSEIWSISYAVSIVDCPAATAAVKSSRDRPAVNTSLSKYVRKVWNKIKWRKHMQSIVIYILFTFFVAPLWHIYNCLTKFWPYNHKANVVFQRLPIYWWVW